MTLTAKLQFGNNDMSIYNKEYLIVDCVVHTFRSHDSFFPTEQARNESVELTIVANKTNDLSLQEWYISQEARSGRIHLEMTDSVDNSDTQRDILFEDAICFSLSEKYDINNDKLRMLTLQFVAPKIQIDHVVFDIY